MQTAQIQSLRKVLVVDDSQRARELLNDLLTCNGYDVQEAENGLMALEIAKSYRPQVILLDVMMPDIDGFETCRRLKNIEECSDIPVIFLTAINETQGIANAFDAGGIDYIAKPFFHKEVLARVQVHVELYIERTQCHEYAMRIEADLSKIAADEEAGRKVQMALLPKNDVVLAGYRFRHLLMPSLYMSGDFVDYFLISHRHVLFYALDVSGHGAASAMVSSMLYGLVRRLCQNTTEMSESVIEDPALLLKALNGYLLDAATGRHAALFCGILEPNEGKLLYANSGYFPFPIIGRGESAKMIECKSVPLGLFKGAKYSTTCIDLPNDSDLMLYSDGIMELMPENSIDEQMSALCSLSAEERIDPQLISDKFKLSEAKERPDDITIMSISRRTS